MFGFLSDFHPAFRLFVRFLPGFPDSDGFCPDLVRFQASLSARTFSNAPRVPTVSLAAQEAVFQMTIDDLIEPMPTWLNLESVKKLSEVEKITSLSAESLRRRFPQYIVKLTE